MTTLTPTLRNISSTLYNTTDDISSLKIVSGMSLDDTLRIEFEDGKIIYASYDEDDEDTLLWTEYAYNSFDEEEVVCEGGYRDMSDGDIAALYLELKNF